MDILQPQEDNLEFAKSIFGVSTLKVLGSAQFMKQCTPFAKFLFGLVNFESEDFNSLTVPVTCRSLIFRHR